MPLNINQTLLLHAYATTMASVDNTLFQASASSNPEALREKAKAAYAHACDLVNHA